MPTVDILEIARRHLGAAASLFYAPDIPADRLAAARIEHAVHLRETEPILVLCDVTVFGSADEGFLVTPERLCWRNFLGSARQMEWHEPAAIAVADGTLQIAGAPLHLSPTAPSAERVAAFLREVAAASEQPHGRGPYRADAAAEGRLEGKHVVRIARQRIGDLGSVHYAPSIPARKIASARHVHRQLQDGEEILVLYDATVFGGAREGFVVSALRLCWKNPFAAARCISWRALAPSDVGAEGGSVRVGSERLTVLDQELARRFAALFAELARLARQGIRTS